MNTQHTNGHATGHRRSSTNTQPANGHPLAVAWQDRVAELEAQLASAEQDNARLHNKLDMIELATSGSQDGLWNWDLITNEAYLSPKWKSILGYEDHDLPNHLDSFSQALHPEDSARTFAAVEANIADGARFSVEVRMRCKDGSYRWILSRGDTMRDETGKPLRMAGAIMDITDQKLAEEAIRRAVVQDEIIKAQEMMLAELSTPLIPISDRIVVMPLIGSIDTRRAQQVLDNLMHGIERHRAHTVILDITGVAVVDTQVANMLIRAAQAAQLLGTQVMLTGIRPEVAQTLVGLGIDLRHLVTHGSLQQGVASALVQRGSRG